MPGWLSTSGSGSRSAASADSAAKAATLGGWRRLVATRLPKASPRLARTKGLMRKSGLKVSRMATWPSA